jgi:hypothetical protein
VDGAAEGFGEVAAEAVLDADGSEVAELSVGLGFGAEAAELAAVLEYSFASPAPPPGATIRLVTSSATHPIAAPARVTYGLLILML